jgi:hypothetical protein
MISDPKILELLKQLVGEGVQINESPKTQEEREENLFIELLETVEAAWAQEHEIYENYGIDLVGFSQYLYHAIETLIVLKYGYFRANAFWWYALERFDADGNLLGLEDEEGKTYFFKTHKQFYKFFKNLKG